MKRLIVLMLAIGIVGYSYGQKKPKIGQAEKERSEGNLGVAKDIIDEASEYEKLKDDGKTWYYRGLVYASLDTTQNPEYKSLAADPLKTAMESFAKADEMAKGSSEYYVTGANGFPVTKSQQLDQLWGYYLNKGVEYYNVDDAKGAYGYFQKMTVVKPQDTTGYYYAASMAQVYEDYETALKNYYVLVNDLDMQATDVYNSIIYIEGTVNDNPEKALEYARKAKAEFPNDPEFAKSEISALIKLERLDEARTELEAAIDKDPNNPALTFTLGVMYEEVNQPDKAKEAYIKSIEADPNYLNSRFNLAVISYNQAVELIKERNNLGISAADQKKAKAMQADIDVKLKESLPHWEKVHELQPKDKTALETLQYLYTQMKMYDNAEAIANKLDALGDSE